LYNYFLFTYFTSPKRKKNNQMETSIQLTKLQQAQINLSNSAKRAVFIYTRLIKEGFERSLETWRNALRESWKATKALIAGVVTFAKIKTGEITTRRIKALSNAAPKDDLIRVTDLEKDSIISFHTFQITSL